MIDWRDILAYHSPTDIWLRGLTSDPSPAVLYLEKLSKKNQQIIEYFSLEDKSSRTG